MRPNRTVTCSLLLLAVAAGTAAPAQPRSAEPGVGEQLAGIRLALDRLVELQEVDNRNREIDIVMKRIDLWVRRLAPLESRLASAESRAHGDEETLRSLDRMREQNQDELAALERAGSGSEEQRAGLRNMLQDIDRTRLDLEESIKAARMRAQEIEIELDRGRKEIKVLDDTLTELLEDAGRPRG